MSKPPWWWVRTNDDDGGLLAKFVTTLDVLPGGRAWLGIGAAWTRRSTPVSASDSPRSRSATNCWRTPCASACRCGPAATGPSKARMRTWCGPSTSRWTWATADATPPRCWINSARWRPLGAQAVIGVLAGVHRIDPIVMVGQEIIPHIRDLWC